MYLKVNISKRDKMSGNINVKNSHFELLTEKQKIKIKMCKYFVSEVK